MSVSEREQIENAIRAIQAQQAALGEEVTQTVLAALRARLATAAEDDERKLVTIMFADLSGFTSLIEQNDPETVRGLVNACFERFVKIVERYEGTVEKFIGDEIMAMFGAPIAHEDDAERAVRTALDMMSELARFNQERHTQLGIHIGINTGLVLAGSIGAGEQQQYGVTGDAVNLAARLKSVAHDGQILLGQDTYRLTEAVFDFETLEPLRVKGKTELVQAYAVQNVKTARGRGRGLETRGIGSTLVGRDTELAKIKGSVEKLLHGRGGITTLIGEAGLGKSRMLAEVRRWAVNSESTLQWFEGRTLSFGEQISYWVIQDLLRNYAEITDDDDEDKAWDKLEASVSRVLPTAELYSVVPFLANLLAIEAHGDYVARMQHMEGEVRRQILGAMRRFVEALAQVQPMVLVFEDLHWVDESSSLLVEHLLSLVDDVPLLIILVTRPVPNPAGARIFESALRGHAEHYTQVRLYPLSPAESIQLLHNLIEIEGLPTSIHESIVNKVDGNPFYMEEVIRALIDSGGVVRDEARGRWVATSRIESIALPDTIQGVIMTRVDRLDDHVKEVLRTAAVIGRSFLYRVLQAVLAGEAAAPWQLNEHLNELREIDLIREKRRHPELEYAFNHALAHDAVYESVVLQKRRDLHARVGEAIERLFAEKLDEFFGVLAYHFARGERWEKAQEYLLKAGDQAGQMAADAEALTHYRQALAAYGAKLPPLQRATLERKIGEVFLRRGEHQQAMEHFYRALAHMGKPLPRKVWELNTAIALGVLEQGLNRLRPMPLRGVRLLSGTTPTAEEESRLYEAIAWGEVFVDQKMFVLLALKQLNVSEYYRYDYGVAVGASALGAVCDSLGWFEIARRYHEYAVQMATEVKEAMGIATAHFQRSNHNFFVCAWAEALQDSARALEKYEQVGYLRGQGLALYIRGMTANYRGEFLRMMATGHELITLGLTQDDSQVWSWGLFVEAMARARLGVIEEALIQLEQAIEVAESIPDNFTLAIARSELARCYAQQDELLPALSEMQKVMELIKGRTLISTALTPIRNNYAAICLALAEKEGAGRGSETLRRAQVACAEALQHGGAFQAGKVEALRLRGVYEWLNGNKRGAQRWWRESLKWGEVYAMPYEKGLTMLEMGKRLKDTELLRAAKWLFESLDAEGDFERVKQVME